MTDHIIFHIKTTVDYGESQAAMEMMVKKLKNGWTIISELATNDFVFYILKAPYETK